MMWCMPWMTPPHFTDILRRPQDNNDVVYALDDAPLFTVILRRPQDDSKSVGRHPKGKYVWLFFPRQYPPGNVIICLQTTPKSQCHPMFAMNTQKIDCHPEASEGSGCSLHFLTTISSFIKNA
jgi:hypothetical protein